MRVFGVRAAVERARILAGMAQFNPPELRRLTAFMESLPHCPHGCGNSAVYSSPTFRVPTPDNTIDDQVSEIIERYGPEAAGMLRRHLAEDHDLEACR